MASTIQCWIPVLEGLLPDSQHNKILLDLAFDLATWHAYAKLRLHTTHTINSLRTQSKELGCLLRRYANKLCPKYATKPLPGESAAAYCRKAKKVKKAGPTPQALSGCSFYGCKIRSFSDFVFENIHSFYFFP